MARRKFSIGTRSFVDITCWSCKKRVGVAIDPQTVPTIVVCNECEQKICPRCGLPIKRGDARIEGAGGALSHFGCVGSILANAVEEDGGLGLDD